jgi:hypothetical protein
MSRAFIAGIVVLVLFFLVTVILHGWWRRRRVARGRARMLPPTQGRDGTPRDRLIGLSGSLREALADRLGPVYRARTIEELFADNELGELLGAEPLEQLTHFLAEVDKLKFAPERAACDQQALQLELADWTPRVENLTKHIRAKVAGKGDRKPRIRGRGQQE